VPFYYVAHIAQHKHDYNKSSLKGMSNKKEMRKKKMIPSVMREPSKAFI